MDSHRRPVGPGHWLVHAVVVLLIAAVVAVVGDSPSAASAYSCGGATATIVGTNHADVLVGTGGPDVIVGLGGNDVIKGKGGADRLCGGGGSDTILGAGGKDKIWGDGGDDEIDGGPRSDTVKGGPGFDTCTSSETRSSCEVVIPSACANPALAKASEDTQYVDVTGSNAFETEASFAIDGEVRRLTFVAELENDSGSDIRLGRIEIAIFDGFGARIGTRFVYATAYALAPGERAVFRETMPSLIYSSDETNDFPDGWASWKVIVHATQKPAMSYDDVLLSGTLKSLTETDSGDLEGEVRVENTLDHEIDTLHWWIVLYNGNGRLINVETDTEFYFSPKLAAGTQMTMPIEFDSDEPICFASTSAGAAGS